MLAMGPGLDAGPPGPVPEKPTPRRAMGAPAALYYARRGASGSEGRNRDSGLLEEEARCDRTADAT